MTVPVDSAFCYAAGHLFALAGSDAMEEDPGREGECLWRGRLFTALAVVPVGLLFLARWPEWSWMYCAGRRSRSRLLGALGLSLYVVAHELGFRNAARLIRAGKTSRAHVQTALALGLAGLVSLAGAGRMMRLGTCEEFRDGTARVTFLSPGFWAAIVASGVLVVPAALEVVVRNMAPKPA